MIYTHKTIVNLPHLHRELLQTRSVGFAIDNEEFSEGIDALHIRCLMVEAV